eukprot:704077-Lingulodinium_polyedra.AAC.1
MLYIMHDACPDEFWLPKDMAGRFAKAGRIALLAYSDLARAAKESNLALWPFKPKHHQLDHIVSLVSASCWHPARNWAFCDEDFNGRIMAMVKSSDPRALIQRTMQKYSLRLCLSVRTDAKVVLGGDASANDQTQHCMRACCRALRYDQP